MHATALRGPSLFLLCAGLVGACGGAGDPLPSGITGGTGGAPLDGGQPGTGGTAGQPGTGGTAGSPAGTGGSAGSSSGTGGSAGGVGGSSSGTGGAAGGTGGSSGGTIEVGEGQSCLGFRAGPIPVCKAGLFCEFPPGTCNAPDVSGTCVNGLPVPCAAGGTPVCGCDQKTYANDCIRRSSHAQLDHKGPCEMPPPPPAGSVGAFCGGLKGFPCNPGLFCDPTPGLCNSPDAGGTCQLVPTACTREYSPVCGCNGVTYGNDCTRQVAKVGKKDVGVCPMASGLTPGTWGGVGASVLIKDPKFGAQVELDCAHGTIDGPLVTNGDGSFKWRGTYTIEGGPTPVQPPAGGTTMATYFGTVANGVISFQILIDGASSPSTTRYSVALGKMPILHKCL